MFGHFKDNTELVYFLIAQRVRKAKKSAQYCLKSFNLSTFKQEIIKRYYCVSLCSFSVEFVFVI